MIEFYLKIDGKIYNLLNKQITDIYEEYRDEQKKVGTRHYSYMWFNIKISMVEKSPEAVPETLKDEPRTTKGNLRNLILICRGSPH